MNKIPKKLNNGHITQGIYSILSNSFIFDLFQWMIGDNNLKKRFVKEFVKPFEGAKILDIGCGTGRILDFIPMNIEYTGYDLSPEYIEYASKRYKGRGKFFCSKIDTLSTKQNSGFDIVIAKAVLHHIDDNEAKIMFEIASKNLKPNGYVVTLDGVFIENQSKIAKYLISKDRGKHVRTIKEYVDLAKSYFYKVDSFILHDMYRVPYTIFIMKCFK